MKLPHSIISKLALTLLTLTLGACASPKVAQPLTQTVGGNDPGQQLDFWHGLADRPMTANDEAFHGVILYLDGKDSANNYDDRVKLLQSKGLLPTPFTQASDDALSRGTLAVIIVKALQIKGGWALSLFPWSPRYAVRELEYDNLFPASSPNQTFSGAEFVGIIGRVEDYQNGNSANLPASQLPNDALPPK